MFMILLVGALFNSVIQGDLSYDECKAQNFNAKSCWNSEQLYKAGNYLCKVQGKTRDESKRSECK